MPMPDHRSGLSYAYFKFRSAVHMMAASPLGPRERLIEAAREFNAVSEEDLPTDARPLFRDYERRTNVAADAGKGTYPATMAMISEVEVRSLIDLVCEIESVFVNEFISAKPSK